MQSIKKISKTFTSRISRKKGEALNLAKHSYNKDFGKKSKKKTITMLYLIFKKKSQIKMLQSSKMTHFCKISYKKLILKVGLQMSKQQYKSKEKLIKD